MSTASSCIASKRPGAIPYALYAIFASTRYPHAGSEYMKYQTNFVPLIPSEELEALGRPYLAKLAERQSELDRLGGELARQRKAGGDLTSLQAARDTARRAWEEVRTNPPHVDAAYAVADGQPAEARIQQRGDPRQLGDEVPRGFPRALGGEPLPREVHGSGRLELAVWLTETAAPLTARVLVNRIWQHHFGKGLVDTPNDFGHRGQPPADPALLDWLALQLIEGGWSIKTMHRLLVLSSTQEGLNHLQRVERELRANGTPAEDRPADAWSSYARVLLGSNEFFTLD
jgi:hypothetical protein